ncbi:MAG: hypothetical protein CRU78_08045 [Candidatus Accumulibacter phosphatis]|uniref:Uncharacterized protein n=1 Tax=Candidatus Accumulibacter phosphatis TaxID=327160 RepID=A0A6A7RT24_9PROT|nr:hypothetical protein [Candidatus Accumulibacter phosphatis]
MHGVDQEDDRNFARGFKSADHSVRAPPLRRTVGNDQARLKPLVSSHLGRKLDCQHAITKVSEASHKIVTHLGRAADDDDDDGLPLHGSSGGRG